MNKIYVRLTITVLIAIAVGCAAMWPVIDSQNGYVAGFIYFPLFILICSATIVLVIVGLATIKTKVGPYLLLAAFLLPGSFFATALTAKHFEWGAYREEPVVSLTPAFSNIVIFNKGVSNDQIQNFWNATLATQRDDGRGYASLPGLQLTGSLFPRDGHEVVQFNFFDNATEEQREFVYSRARSSPIVFKLLENVSTKEYMGVEAIPANGNSTGRPKKEMRIDNLKQKE